MGWGPYDVMAIVAGSLFVDREAVYNLVHSQSSNEARGVSIKK